MTFEDGIFYFTRYVRLSTFMITYFVATSTFVFIYKYDEGVNDLITSYAYIDKNA